MYSKVFLSIWKIKNCIFKNKLEEWSPEKYPTMNKNTQDLKTIVFFYIWSTWIKIAVCNWLVFQSNFGHFPTRCQKKSYCRPKIKQFPSNMSPASVRRAQTMFTIFTALITSTLSCKIQIFSKIYDHLLRRQIRKKEIWACGGNEKFAMCDLSLHCNK